MKPLLDFTGKIHEAVSERIEVQMHSQQKITHSQSLNLQPILSYPVFALMAQPFLLAVPNSLSRRVFCNYLAHHSIPILTSSSPYPPSPLLHELLFPGLKHSVVFFPRYLCYWKTRFKEKPITEFCPVIKINSKPDGRLLSKKVSSDINASGIVHFFIYLCMYVIASCTSHPRDSSLQVCNHFHSCEKDGHKSKDYYVTCT